MSSGAAAGVSPGLDASGPGAAAGVLHLELASRQRACIGAAPPVDLALRDAALLAWLALEGPTTRARLAALLWPDGDAESARNALRQRLFQLRRQLGVDVVSGSATLALAQGVTHDLEDSDSVLGVAEPAAPGEFADWLAQQRLRRLARTRQSLIELAQMAETSGDWPDAVSHAQELLALEPLSEDAHRRLMRLHYLMGDRAAALQDFDRCERVLKDEIGAQPGPQTMALLRQIERAEADLPAAGAGLPAVLLRPPRLVGRTQVWARMAEAWRERTPMLLRGEGGLGKSRLLADFVQSRKAELPSELILVVGGRPGDAERAFGLAARLLRAVVALPGWTVGAGVQRELARLLPELGVPPPPSAGGEARLAGAVEAALEAACRHGLVAIAVDDLHWSDADSLGLLRSLSGSADLRSIFAMRQVEGGQPAAELQTEWLASRPTGVIDLRPLSQDDVATLLDSLGLFPSDPELKPARLHRRSGGNPMFLLECLKAHWSERLVPAAPPGTDPGPGTPPAEAAPAWPMVPVVQRQIAQRLLRFSPMAVRLLRCAAVAGQDFGAGLAAAVLQVRPLDLADAWVELESAQVLSDGAFAHDLVFEAALASVPAPIARELHREIAQALQAASAAPERVAMHWLSAGAPELAVEPLLRAARGARAAKRPRDAETWFAQAAAILEQRGEPAAAFDALFSAAEAQSEVGLRYEDYVERVATLARTEEQALFAEVLRGAHWLNQGRTAEVRTLAHDGLRRARVAGCVEAESEFEWLLFHVAWASGDMARAIEHGERDLALQRQLPSEGTRMDTVTARDTLLSSLALALTNSGRFLDGRARHREALDELVRRRAVHKQAMCATNLLHAELAIGRLALAQELGERIARLLDDDLVHEHDRLYALGALGLLHGQDGRWGMALRRLDELGLCLERTPSGYAPTLLVTQVHLWLAIGRRDLAQQALDRIEPGLPDGASLFRLVHDTYRCVAAKQRGGEALLAPISAVGNVVLRLRLLLVLAPQLDAAAVLPLLNLASAQVRDGGAWGFWLALQARRASALARLGQAESASSAAREAWERHGGGDMPVMLQPEFAADLAEALQATDPALAAVIAQRGRDALASAAASLESPWRESCLERSPMLLRLAALQARLPG